MEKWFDVPEKEGSSVICSRVRLVRNWREYPFPGKMTKEQSVEMTGRLMNGVKESGAFSGSRSRHLSGPDPGPGADGAFRAQGHKPRGLKEKGGRRPGLI